MLERFLDCLGSIDYDSGQLDLDEMRRCVSAGSDRELIEYYCIVIECLHLEVPSVLSALYLAKLDFLYRTKFRIERHQLSSGIVSSELPLDTSCMFIALPLPCRQFLTEQIHVLNPAGQTLSCHYI